mmetsp:Transcript_11361/g.17049  ORF Transcript_11361/g.17049 Transcript_11361/m.17049 type:complete len:93 (-) Transcript_11361:135-413(-)
MPIQREKQTLRTSAVYILGFRNLFNARRKKTTKKIRNREGMSHSLEYNCLSFERSLNENLCGGGNIIPGNMASNNGNKVYFDIMNFSTALLN